MKPGVLIGLIVLVLLGGAFLLGRRGDAPTESVGAQQSETDTGYVALDAQIIETAADGALLYSLNADRITQQPATGDVRMQAITLFFHHDAQTLWRLSANTGHLPGGSTRIELGGNVRASGTLPESRLPADIATEQLTFDTHSQDLESKQLVTILLDGQRLTSRGLTANLMQERVRLESAVHGRYSR